MSIAGESVERNVRGEVALLESGSGSDRTLRDLLRQSGFRVRMLSGAVAVEEGRRPDVLLVPLPSSGDAFTVARALSADGIAVVMVGSGGSDEQKRALASGAADYLAMDTDREMLVARLETQLRIASLQADVRRLGQELAERERIIGENTRRMDEARRELDQAKMEDTLTRTSNMRRFYEVLEHEWKRANRSRTELSLVLFDLDSFRAYNDAYGRVAGDECLRKVAETLRAAFSRAGDIVARYGGGTFAALMPATGYDEASRHVEALRGRILELEIPHERSSEGLVTISAGLATTMPGLQASPTRLIATADSCLAAAKEAGRNRVSGKVMR